MSRRTEKIIERALKRVAAIREALGAMELLCSGTLLQRMKVCGKPGCRCASEQPLCSGGDGGECLPFGLDAAREQIDELQAALAVANSGGSEVGQGGDIWAAAVELPILRRAFGLRHLGRQAY